MKSGDRVAMSLSVWEAVDRQDPEPHQTEEEEEEEVGEGGWKEGRTGNDVRKTSLFTLFCVVFLKLYAGEYS